MGNTTKGTKDVVNDQFIRTLGLSRATWSRKLVTGDKKDVPITNSSVYALFAHGDEDYFTFHGNNFLSCQVNFITGVYNCHNVGTASAVVA